MYKRQILTRCQTVEEFIDHFHDRTGPRTIFVHTTEGRNIGEEYGFAVLLADKQPMLSGTCVVLAVYQDANNPFKRRGMQLGVKRLSPESESIFSALDAARELRAQPNTLVEPLPAVAASVSLPPVPLPSRRPVPSRMTQPLLVVSTDTGLLASDGKVEAVISRRTERLATRTLTTLTVPPRTTQALPIVQIPPREELTRTPRGTPAVVGPDKATTEPATEPTVPRHVNAEGSTRETRTSETRTPETRTPGSSFILPANPLTDVTDASLEGLVDGRWGDSSKIVAPEPVVLSAPTVPARALTSDVAYIVEQPIVEPSVIPVPRFVRPSVAPPIAEPRIVPRVTTLRRSWKRPLAIAAAILLVVVVVRVSVSRESTTLAGPSVVVESDEVVGLEVRATVGLDPLPSAPARVATTMHAVMVKTYPTGALVTVNGTSFGTTPTFARVPAFTPVELHVTLAGYPPVVHTMTSNTITDRVFLDLRRSNTTR